METSAQSIVLKSERGIKLPAARHPHRHCSRITAPAVLAACVPQLAVEPAKRPAAAAAAGENVFHS